MNATYEFELVHRPLKSVTIVLTPDDVREIVSAYSKPPLTWCASKVFTDILKALQTYQGGAK